MKYSSFYLLCLLFLSTSCHKSISKLQLEENLQYIADKHRFAGYGVALFDKDSVYFVKGYGLADRQKQTPYTPDTRQIIASVSKMFIGFSLLKCQELGYVDLQDPINAHLPFKIHNPYFPDEDIRIKHLVTHTASFVYSEKMSDQVNYQYADSSLAFFVQNYFTPDGIWYTEENFHAKKPGELWEYSNMGAVLAALLVEEVSGLSYEGFLVKYLCKPLGIDVARHLEQDQKKSLHYDLETEEEFVPFPRKQMGLHPAGDYLASVEDMILFVQMLMNEGTINGTTILSESSVQEMLAPHLPRKIEMLDPEGYDSGIFVFHDKNILGNPKKVRGHIGGDTGIFTSVWFEPKSGMGYIFLTNTSRSSLNFDATIFLWQSLYKYSKRIR